MIVSGPERQVTASASFDVMAGGVVTALTAFCRDYGYQSLIEPHQHPKAATFAGHNSGLHSIGIIWLDRCALRPGQHYALEVDFREGARASESSYTISLGYLPTPTQDFGYEEVSAERDTSEPMNPAAAAKVMQQLIDHLAPPESDGLHLNVSNFGRIPD